MGEQTERIICDSCGKELDPRLANDGVIECPACGSFKRVLLANLTADARDHIRSGFQYLDSHADFGHAQESFKSAAEESKFQEPEAYWGWALADMEVRYLKDIVWDEKKGDFKSRLQPICFSASPEKFVNNEHYKKAIQLATPTQREKYQKMAQEIDEIKDAFQQYEATGEDYDCFLCVKVTNKDDDGSPIDESQPAYAHTQDSYFAEEIFKLLENNNFKVFYSESEKMKKTMQGRSYEASILYALHKSETMLVICSDKRYLDTKWVQNEYKRFLRLQQLGDKEPDSLGIVYYGKVIENLPGRVGPSLQGIDYGLPNQLKRNNLILDFVDKHSPAAKERKEREAKERAEAIERERAEKERRDKEANERWQRMQEELANLRNNATAGTGGINVANAITSAQRQLRSGKIEDARNLCNRIINEIDVNNVSAHWLLGLIDNKARDVDELVAKCFDKPGTVCPVCGKPASGKCANCGVQAIEDYNAIAKRVEDVLNSDEIRTAVECGGATLPEYVDFRNKVDQKFQVINDNCIKQHEKIENELKGSGSKVLEQQKYLEELKTEVEKRKNELDENQKQQNELNSQIKYHNNAIEKECQGTKAAQSLSNYKVFHKNALDLRQRALSIGGLAWVISLILLFTFEMVAYLGEAEGMYKFLSILPGYTTITTKTYVTGVLPQGFFLALVIYGLVFGALAALITMGILYYINSKNAAKERKSKKGYEKMARSAEKEREKIAQRHLTEINTLQAQIQKLEQSSQPLTTEISNLQTKISQLDKDLKSNGKAVTNKTSSMEHYNKVMKQIEKVSKKFQRS